MPSCNNEPAGRVRDTEETASMQKRPPKSTGEARERSVCVHETGAYALGMRNDRMAWGAGTAVVACSEGVTTGGLAEKHNNCVLASPVRGLGRARPTGAPTPWREWVTDS